QTAQKWALVAELVLKRRASSSSFSRHSAGVGHLPPRTVNPWIANSIPAGGANCPTRAASPAAVARRRGRACACPCDPLSARSARSQCRRRATRLSRSAQVVGGRVRGAGPLACGERASAGTSCAIRTGAVLAANALGCRAVPARPAGRKPSSEEHAMSRFWTSLVVAFCGISAARGATLHLDRIKLPPDFHIAVYAENVPNAREMVLAPSGVLFVSTRRAGNVYAVVDSQHRGRADRVITLARGLEN